MSRFLKTKYLHRLNNIFFITFFGILGQLMHCKIAVVYRSFWKIGLLKIKILFCTESIFVRVKGAPSGLTQLVVIGSHLKMLKNTFCFVWEALFVLKIFRFLSWLFGHVEKRLDQKDGVNLNIYDVTAWERNNCKTHIAQYLKKQKQSNNEIWSVNRI